MEATKAERRESRERNARKMRMDGRSIKTLGIVRPPSQKALRKGLR